MTTRTEDVTVSDHDLLAERFETHRDHLRAVALRMLGSSQEADDAVQEAWLRLSRADTDAVANLGGWLTTVVARVCLDMLRARSTKREVPSDGAPDPVAVTSPEEEVLLADSVGLALLIVLDTLAPDERLAFVLHDMFAVPFEEIAPIVDRSPAAARQLASRARRRVQGGETSPTDRRRKQEVVEAFLAASRHGDFEALVALLHPDAALRADPAAVKAATANRDRGAPPLAPEVRGAGAVAEALVGQARAAQLALIDGAPGAVWAPGGRPRAVFAFNVVGDSIAEIEIIIEPRAVSALDVELV
jgi:RNA polymerase sigma factor (sigma-70 family)